MTDQKFSEIVTQYERLVYTICYQFTKNHHTAEDLVQETFVSAYKHKESCPIESMKPWLARIATNKAKDFLKSAYNRRVQAAGEEGIPENGIPLFIKEEQPEDIAIEKEAFQAIEIDIRSLKEPYAMVSVMYFLEDRSVEEIATHLERPPKTVHTQIYRAKRILQDKLKGGGANGNIQ